MDISFRVEDEKFNYRVCAIFVHEGKLLAMHDDRSPYYYLPGGRVTLGETAEDAVLREVREELGVQAKIERALWLNQSFFREDVDQLAYHELCVYFLMETNEQLLALGERFALREGRHTNRFEWLAFERLEKEYFYPIFLKKAIFDLPEAFTLRIERE